MALLIHVPFNTATAIDATGNYTLSEDSTSPDYQQTAVAPWGGSSCNLRANDRLKLDTELVVGDASTVSGGTASSFDMTAMAWVHCIDSDHPSYICGGGSGGDGMAILRDATAGDDVVEARFGGDLIFGRADAPAEGANHHIAITRLGSSGAVSIYVDGVEVPEYAYGDLDPTTSEKDWKLLYIGGRTDTASDFEGRIQDFRVYDEVLPLSTIKRIKDNSRDAIASHQQLFTPQGF